MSSRSPARTSFGQAFIYYLGSGLNTPNNLEKQRGLTGQARFNTNQVGGDFGGRIIRDKTFFLRLLPGEPNPHGAVARAADAHPDPIRLCRAEHGTATRRDGKAPAQTAASRQAVLDSIRFLQDVYARNPRFTNLSTININGVPIQTGIVQLPITQPADAYNFVIRGRPPVQRIQPAHRALHPHG